MACCDIRPSDASITTGIPFCHQYLAIAEQFISAGKFVFGVTIFVKTDVQPLLEKVVNTPVNLGLDFFNDGIDLLGGLALQPVIALNELNDVPATNSWVVLEVDQGILSGFK